MQKIMFSTRYGLEQATIAGDKTMTRRIIKLPLIAGLEDIREADMEVQADGSLCAVFRGYMDGEPYTICKVKPRYRVGEEVWIAQSYRSLGYKPDDWIENSAGGYQQAQELAGYTNKMFVRSLYLTRRIRITNIRVERMQDISKADCIKEGIGKYHILDKHCHYGFPDNNYDDRSYAFPTPQQAFAELIKRTCGSRVWRENPWTFAYEYSSVK